MFRTVLKNEIIKQKCLSWIQFGWALFHSAPIMASDEMFDVAIPCIEKDLKILPLCLEGIRNCIKTLNDVYIIAPAKPAIINFCKEHNVIFIDEVELMGFSPKSIDFEVGTEWGSVKRGGWLFQQMIKLSGRVGTCRYCLFIDADHILIRPLTFISQQGSSVFYMSEYRHNPYYRNMGRLVGLHHDSIMSYVAHKMIFDKEQLNELRALIEQRFGMPWIDAIIESYNKSELSGFSEFETYGNFVKNKVLRPWKNLTLPYKQLEPYLALQRKYGLKYNSITFPEFVNH